MFHALYFRRSLLLETKTEYLYHGSDWPNQKVLEPRKSGFEKDHVFATDNLIEAVIFLSKKRNSLQATWDVNCEDRSSAKERKASLRSDISELQGPYTPCQKEFLEK